MLLTRRTFLQSATLAGLMPGLELPSLAQSHWPQSPVKIIVPFTAGANPGQVGPFAIRWYALAYVAGILLGWRYCVRLIRNQKLLFRYL